jgi:eukaryotic-like serine/threonine-protein kinase
MTLSLIGKRIGNYDIQAKIGEGGMGMVYLGVHPQIGKRVAIKVLHEELSSKADVVSRFFTEARSVNDINHPNIVDIVDFGDYTCDGTVFKYIIMEFLEGESLSSRIRREGVTIRETLHIMAQCASALAASHGKGVVHRDLKPENIYLLPRGQDRNYVKLLDFGIAKLTGDGVGGAAMSSKTRTGMVIGTPAYMSPEQCEGRGLIDHRSDIYALGVVMYELLTGRVPFPGDGFGEVLVAHLTRDPDPPSQLNPNLPPEIEAIVVHCLRKDKGQRFQSMSDLLSAINDPVAHFQLWAQSAQLPAGTASANAFMSTVFSSPSPPAPSWPAATGPLPSGPQGWQPQGAPTAGSGMNLAVDAPVVSGQGPTSTGMAVLRPSAPLEPMAPAHTGPRPTTLSGASGEATGTGRRPASVLLMLGGAVALGIAITVGVKLAKRPPRIEGPVVTAQGEDRGKDKGPAGDRGGDKGPDKAPAAELVTIQIKSDPPQADVIRGDEIDGPPGKTPLTLKVKKGAPLDLKLRLPGYNEETRSVPTAADGVVEVALSKAEDATPSGDRGRRIRGDRSRKDRGSSSSSSSSRRHRRGRTDGTELLPPIF